MALYRNIAGFDPYEQVGLLGFSSLLTPDVPTTGGNLTLAPAPTFNPVVQILPAGTTWGSSPNLDQIEAQHQALFAAVDAENLRRYNYLLTTSPYDLTQAGYYVDTDDYIRVWTDAAHTTSAGYLDLDIIQGIENKAGTAGALFMHMNLPLIAKDTAGYGGSSRASEGATTMYSTPIPEVLNLPTAPTGPNVVENYTPQTNINVPPPTGGGSTTTPATPTTTHTTTPTTPTTATPATPAVSGNTLGFIGLGLAALAVIRSKKLLLIGGLGLLYYSIQQKQIVTNAS